MCPQMLPCDLGQFDLYPCVASVLPLCCPCVAHVLPLCCLCVALCVAPCVAPVLPLCCSLCCPLCCPCVAPVLPLSCPCVAAGLSLCLFALRCSHQPQHKNTLKLKLFRGFAPKVEFFQTVEKRTLDTHALKNAVKRNTFTLIPNSSAIF